MNRSTLLLGGAFLLLLVGGVWISRSPKPLHNVQIQPQAVETIESSGRILGIAIGSAIQEARERLDPLRVPSVYTPDLKEQTGRRIYWKLKETDYDWIMVWANGEGKVTRIRAVFRTEKTKPFHEIGNLQTAASAEAKRVKWNLRRPDGPYFRLIAQGADQRANTVYMFSLESDDEQQRSVALDPEEKP